MEWNWWMGSCYWHGDTGLSKVESSGSKGIKDSCIVTYRKSRELRQCDKLSNQYSDNWIRIYSESRSSAPHVEFA
jgi:hypothetical protein